MDLMGSAQFRTPKPQWEKLCCSNPRGPFIQPPTNITDEEVGKISDQINRIPELTEVGK